MNEEIIENYPIPEDMLNTPLRSKWPFASFKIASAIRVADWPSFYRARAAAFATGKRRGWKFKARWDKETEIGLIVRVE